VIKRLVGQVIYQMAQIIGKKKNIGFSKIKIKDGKLLFVQLIPKIN